MTPAQNRYLFVQSAIGAAIGNGLINGLIGVAAMHGHAELGVWTIPGVVSDVIATAFGVAFGTSLGTVLQVKNDLAHGKIAPPFELGPALGGLMARMPASLLKRALAVGVVAVPIFAPPVVVALGLSHATALDKSSMIALKTAFSALEGAVVAPFVVLAALLKATRAPS
jgi:hypothetical protein